jgi:hypothetical protein
VKNPSDSAAERQATSNLAAFLHWLRAVHGLRLDHCDSPVETLQAWVDGNPSGAASLILTFAGDGFASARLAAGLLLRADLRPDDRILTAIAGPAPDWLPQALQATRGRAATAAQATVLVTDTMPHSLPPGIKRVILVGAQDVVDAHATAPPGVTLSRSADWTYPRESSAA